MENLTRREWNGLVLSGLAAGLLGRRAEGADTAVPAKTRIDSKFKGVQIGVQSYSFRDRPLDGAIQGMAEAGLGSVELWQGHLEPRQDWRQMDEAARKNAREELRKWRLTTPLATLREIGDEFRAAGIEVYAYNYSFRDDFTDPEMDRGFEMAKALGAKVLTASSNQKTVPRIDAFARKHKMRVGLHNHSRIDPNEFATGADLEKAMAASSEYICTNLDIGHFTAANQDSVEFIKKHHDRIVTLHIKDRKRDQGPAVPFGTGDAPIKAVLNLLSRNAWPIPSNIEYEYEGKDTAEEVKACLAYCRRALGG
jgi:sugar phosphate isomerase/epimerase